MFYLYYSRFFLFWGNTAYSYLDIQCCSLEKKYKNQFNMFEVKNNLKMMYYIRCIFLVKRMMLGNFNKISWLIRVLLSNLAKCRTWILKSCNHIIPNRFTIILCNNFYIIVINEYERWSNLYFPISCAMKVTFVNLGFPKFTYFQLEFYTSQHSVRII